MKWGLLFCLCVASVVSGNDAIVQGVVNRKRVKSSSSPFDNPNRKADPNSPIVLKQQMVLHERRAKLLEKEANRLMNVDFTMYRLISRQKNDEYLYIQYLQDKCNRYPFVQE